MLGGKSLYGKPYAVMGHVLSPFATSTVNYSAVPVPYYQGIILIIIERHG